MKTIMMKILLEANSQLLVTNYHEGVGGQNTWGSSLR